MTYSSTRVYIHNIHETRDFLREQMEGMAIGSMHEVAGWQRKRQSRRCRKRRDIIQAGVGSRHGSTFISREILRGSRPRGNIYVLYSVREKRREEEYRWIFFFFTLRSSTRLFPLQRSTSAETKMEVKRPPENRAQAKIEKGTERWEKKGDKNVTIKSSEGEFAERTLGRRLWLLRSRRWYNGWAK